MNKVPSYFGIPHQHKNDVLTKHIFLTPVSQDYNPAKIEHKSNVTKSYYDYNSVMDSFNQLSDE